MLELSIGHADLAGSIMRGLSCLSNNWRQPQSRHQLEQFLQLLNSQIELAVVGQYNKHLQDRGTWASQHIPRVPISQSKSNPVTSYGYPEAFFQCRVHRQHCMNLSYRRLEGNDMGSVLEDALLYATVQVMMYDRLILAFGTRLPQILATKYNMPQNSAGCGQQKTRE